MGRKSGRDKKQNYANQPMELHYKAVKAGVTGTAYIARDKVLAPLPDREALEKGGKH